MSPDLDPMPVDVAEAARCEARLRLLVKRGDELAVEMRQAVAELERQSAHVCRDVAGYLDGLAFDQVLDELARRMVAYVQRRAS